MTTFDEWLAASPYRLAEGTANEPLMRQVWEAAVSECVRRVRALQASYVGASADKHNGGNTGGALEDCLSAEAVGLAATAIEARRRGT